MNRLHHKTAFVIRFDPNSESRADESRRVEHLASFKTKRFHSLDELLSFVGRMLKDVCAEETGAIELKNACEKV